MNNLKDESLHKQLAHLLNIVENPEPVQIDKDSTENNSEEEEEAEQPAEEAEPQNENIENEEGENENKENEESKLEEEVKEETTTDNVKSDEIQPVSSVNEEEEQDAVSELPSALKEGGEEEESDLNRASVSTFKSDDERFTEDILNIKRKFTRARSPLIDNVTSSSARVSRISIISQFSPMKLRKSTMARNSKLSASSTSLEPRKSRLYNI